MLPEEFKKRMKSLLNTEYNSFLSTFEQEEEKSIRVNTTKIGVKDFLNLTNFSLEKIPYTDDGFYIKEKNIGNHPYHHAGLFLYKILLL